MGAWVALSRKEHLVSRCRPREGFEFAASRQVIPVILAEVVKLVPHYVTGFVESDDGSYQLVALVGVGGHRNLYVNKASQWLCNYVPASLRAYPFTLLNDADGKKVLCVDEDYLSEDESLPRIFEDDGTLSKGAADTLEFITKCEQNRLATSDVCSALAGAGLIKPWEIAIDRGEDFESAKIDGLHRIDEEKFDSIGADSLLALRNAGALGLAYAQIFSTAQMEQLTQRAKYLANESSKVPPSSSLENLFSSDDSGSLNFDALDS
ncbi:SapC family protein [Pseudohongiella sp.]|uniref:SapC family protein n=1 Tax=marine sediment metagenome TaxID=412755 RepID=A0A0F9VXI7_9ZZZZ|nr:SapC family protein [Pseudohongiella sp.]HDZ08736.1 hypothetical protein [Pseudohongiella sp.]HEA62352.1 hypothetical protein [Pseudohongiella sp.]